MAKKQKTETKTTTENKTTIDNILESMSEKYAIAPEAVQATLLNTAFKGAAKDREPRQSEVNSLLTVANKYDLNPWTREIYGFENKNGVIVPIFSVDGWIKILNRAEGFDGFQFSYGEMIDAGTIGKTQVKAFEWIEISIYFKDRKYPVVIREYLDECYNGGKFGKDPWDTHPKRFLRHKTISQGVRYALGVSEGYERDEVERIDEAIEAETPPELEKPEAAEEIKTEPETIKEPPKEEKKEPAKPVEAENDLKQEGLDLDKKTPDIPSPPPPPPAKTDDIEPAARKPETVKKIEENKKKPIPDFF